MKRLFALLLMVGTLFISSGSYSFQDFGSGSGYDSWWGHQNSPDFNIVVTGTMSGGLADIVGGTLGMIWGLGEGILGELGVDGADWNTFEDSANGFLDGLKDPLGDWSVDNISMNSSGPYSSTWINISFKRCHRKSQELNDLINGKEFKTCPPSEVGDCYVKSRQSGLVDYERRVNELERQLEEIQALLDREEKIFFSKDRSEYTEEEIKRKEEAIENIVRQTDVLVKDIGAQYIHEYEVAKKYKREDNHFIQLVDKILMTAKTVKEQQLSITKQKVEELKERIEQLRAEIKAHGDTRVCEKVLKIRGDTTLRISHRFDTSGNPLSRTEFIKMQLERAIQDYNNNMTSPDLWYKFADEEGKEYTSRIDPSSKKAMTMYYEYQKTAMRETAKELEEVVEEASGGNIDESKDAIKEKEQKLYELYAKMGNAESIHMQNHYSKQAKELRRDIQDLKDGIIREIKLKGEGETYQKVLSIEERQKQYMADTTFMDWADEFRAMEKETERYKQDQVIHHKVLEILEGGTLPGDTDSEKLNAFLHENVRKIGGKVEVDRRTIPDPEKVASLKQKLREAVLSGSETAAKQFREQLEREQDIKVNIYLPYVSKEGERGMRKIVLGIDEFTAWANLNNFGVEQYQAHMVAGDKPGTFKYVYKTFNKEKFEANVKKIKEQLKEIGDQQDKVTKMEKEGDASYALITERSKLSILYSELKKQLNSAYDCYEITDTKSITPEQLELLKKRQERAIAEETVSLSRRQLEKAKQDCKNMAEGTGSGAACDQVMYFEAEIQEAQERIRRVTGMKPYMSGFVNFVNAREDEVRKFMQISKQEIKLDLDMNDWKQMSKEEQRAYTEKHMGIMTVEGQDNVCKVITENAESNPDGKMTIYSKYKFDDITKERLQQYFKEYQKIHIHEWNEMMTVAANIDEKGDPTFNKTFNRLLSEDLSALMKTADDYYNEQLKDWYENGEGLKHALVVAWVESATATKESMPILFDATFNTAMMVSDILGSDIPDDIRIMKSELNGSGVQTAMHGSVMDQYGLATELAGYVSFGLTKYMGSSVQGTAKMMQWAQNATHMGKIRRGLMWGYDEIIAGMPTGLGDFLQSTKAATIKAVNTKVKPLLENVFHKALKNGEFDDYIRKMKSQWGNTFDITKQTDFDMYNVIKTHDEVYKRFLQGVDEIGDGILIGSVMPNSYYKEALKFGRSNFMGAEGALPVLYSADMMRYFTKKSVFNKKVMGLEWADVYDSAGKLITDPLVPEYVMQGKSLFTRSWDEMAQTYQYSEINFGVVNNLEQVITNDYYDLKQYFNDDVIKHMKENPRDFAADQYILNYNKGKSEFFELPQHEQLELVEIYTGIKLDEGDIAKLDHAHLNVLRQRAYEHSIIFQKAALNNIETVEQFEALLKGALKFKEDIASTQYVYDQTTGSMYHISDQTDNLTVIGQDSEKVIAYDKEQGTLIHLDKETNQVSFDSYKLTDEQLGKMQNTFEEVRLRKVVERMEQAITRMDEVIPQVPRSTVLEKVAVDNPILEKTYQQVMDKNAYWHSSLKEALERYEYGSPMYEEITNFLQDFELKTQKFTVGLMESKGNLLNLDGQLKKYQMQFDPFGERDWRVLLPGNDVLEERRLILGDIGSLEELSNKQQLLLRDAVNKVTEDMSKRINGRMKQLEKIKYWENDRWLSSPDLQQEYMDLFQFMDEKSMAMDYYFRFGPDVVNWPYMNEYISQIKLKYFKGVAEDWAIKPMTVMEILCDELTYLKEEVANVFFDNPAKAKEFIDDLEEIFKRKTGIRKIEQAGGTEIYVREVVDDTGRIIQETYTHGVNNDRYLVNYIENPSTDKGWIDMRQSFYNQLDAYNLVGGKKIPNEDLRVLRLSDPQVIKLNKEILERQPPQQVIEKFLAFKKKIGDGTATALDAQAFNYEMSKLKITSQYIPKDDIELLRGKVEWFRDKITEGIANGNLPFDDGMTVVDNIEKTFAKKTGYSKIKEIDGTTKWLKERVVMETRTTYLKRLMDQIANSPDEYGNILEAERIIKKDKYEIMKEIFNETMTYEELDRLANLEIYKRLNKIHDDLVLLGKNDPQISVLQDIIDVKTNGRVYVHSNFVSKPVTLEGFTDWAAAVQRRADLFKDESWVERLKRNPQDMYLGTLEFDPEGVIQYIRKTSSTEAIAKHRITQLAGEMGRLSPAKKVITDLQGGFINNPYYSVKDSLAAKASWYLYSSKLASLDLFLYNTTENFVLRGTERLNEEVANLAEKLVNMNSSMRNVTSANVATIPRLKKVDRTVEGYRKIFKGNSEPSLKYVDFRNPALSDDARFWKFIDSVASGAVSDDPFILTQYAKETFRTRTALKTAFGNTDAERYLRNLLLKRDVKDHDQLKTLLELMDKNIKGEAPLDALFEKVPENVQKEALNLAKGYWNDTPRMIAFKNASELNDGERFFLNLLEKNDVKDQDMLNRVVDTMEEQTKKIVSPLEEFRDISQEVKEQALEVAQKFRENVSTIAFKKTIQQDNFLTRISAKVQQGLNMMTTGRSDIGLGTIYHTFTKVPVNSAIKIFEYSGASVFLRLPKMLWDLKKYTGELAAQMGTMDKIILKKKLIDNMAKAFTGMTFAAGAVILYDLNIITLDPDFKSYVLNTSAIGRLLEGGSTAIKDGDVLMELSLGVLGNEMELTAEGIMTLGGQKKLTAGILKLFKTLAYQGIDRSAFAKFARFFGENFEGSKSQMLYQLQNALAHMPVNLIPRFLKDIRNWQDEYIRKVWERDDLWGWMANKVRNALPCYSDDLEVVITDDEDPLKKYEPIFGFLSRVLPMKQRVVSADEDTLYALQVYHDTKDKGMNPFIDRLRETDGIEVHTNYKANPMGEMDDFSVYTYKMGYTTDNGEEKQARVRIREYGWFEETYYENYLTYVREARLADNGNLTPEQQAEALIKAKEKALATTKEQYIQRMKNNVSGDRYEKGVLFSEMSMDDYLEYYVLEQSFIENSNYFEENGEYLWNPEALGKDFGDFYKKMWEKYPKAAEWKELWAAYQKSITPSDYFRKLEELNKTAELRIIKQSWALTQYTADPDYDLGEFKNNTYSGYVIQYIGAIQGLKEKDALNKAYQENQAAYDKCVENIINKKGCTEELATTEEEKSLFKELNISDEKAMMIYNMIDNNVKFQDTIRDSQFVNFDNNSYSNRPPNAFYSQSSYTHREKRPSGSWNPRIPRSPSYTPSIERIEVDYEDYFNKIEFEDKSLIWMDGASYQDSKIVSSINGFYNYTLLLKMIDSAQETLDISIYGFRGKGLWKKIVDALKRAIGRGVKVRLITDGDNIDPTKESTSVEVQIDTLNSLGINTWDGVSDTSAWKSEGVNSGLMHNKYIIGDNKWVFSGSMNWTNTGFYIGGYKETDWWFVVKGNGVSGTVSNPKVPSISLEDRVIDFHDQSALLTGETHIITLDLTELGITPAEITAAPKSYILESDNEEVFKCYDIYIGEDGKPYAMIMFSPAEEGQYINKVYVKKKHLDGAGNPIYNGHINNTLLVRDTGVVEDYQADFNEMWYHHRFGTSKRASDSDTWVSKMKQWLRSPDNAPKLNNGIPFMVFFTPYKDVYPQKEYYVDYEDKVYRYEATNGSAINIIIDLIQKAEHSIKLFGFSFTDQALVNVLRHKFKDDPNAVRVYMEKRGFNSTKTAQDRIKLLAMSHPVYLHDADDGSLLHSKTIVIDDRIVISGSLNFSQGGVDDNNENCYIINSPEIANTFNRLEAMMLAGYDVNTYMGETIQFRYPFPNSAKHTLTRLKDLPSEKFMAMVNSVGQEEEQVEEEQPVESGEVEVGQEFQEYVDEMNSWVVQHQHFINEIAGPMMREKLLNELQDDVEIIKKEGYWGKLLAYKAKYKEFRYDLGDMRTWGTIHTIAEYVKYVGGPACAFPPVGIPMVGLGLMMEAWSEQEFHASYNILDLECWVKGPSGDKNSPSWMLPRTKYRDLLMEQIPEGDWNDLTKHIDVIGWSKGPKRKHEELKFSKYDICLKYQGYLPKYAKDAENGISYESMQTDAPHCLDGNWFYWVGSEVSRIGIKKGSLSRCKRVCNKVLLYKKCKTKCGTHEFIGSDSNSFEYSAAKNKLGFREVVHGGGTKVVYNAEMLQYNKGVKGAGGGWFSISIPIRANYGGVTYYGEKAYFRTKVGVKKEEVIGEIIYSRGSHYFKHEISLGGVGSGLLAQDTNIYKENTTPVTENYVKYDNSNYETTDEYVVNGGYAWVKENKKLYHTALGRSKWDVYEPGVMEYSIKAEYYNTGQFEGIVRRAKPRKPIFIQDAVISKDVWEALPEKLEDGREGYKNYYQRLNGANPAHQGLVYKMQDAGMDPKKVYILRGFTIRDYSIDSENKGFNRLKVRQDGYILDIPTNTDKCKNIGLDYPEINPNPRYTQGTTTQERVQLKNEILSLLDKAQLEVYMITERMNDPEIRAKIIELWGRGVPTIVVSPNNTDIPSIKVPSIKGNYLFIDGMYAVIKSNSFDEYLENQFMITAQRGMEKLIVEFLGLEIGNFLADPMLTLENKQAPLDPNDPWGQNRPAWMTAWMDDSVDWPINLYFTPYQQHYVNQNGGPLGIYPYFTGKPFPTMMNSVYKNGMGKVLEAVRYSKNITEITVIGKKVTDKCLLTLLKLKAMSGMPITVKMNQNEFNKLSSDDKTYFNSIPQFLHRGDK
jgi:phosphatidylserine/phosphatidylglycerophosphate/cardiolipin synthase-like enzyme